MRRLKYFLMCGALGAIATVHAEQPMLIVQAANSATPAPAATTTAAQNASSLRDTIKSLQEIKAANAETLKKQEAALQQLEEMQKAADQLRIFAHRSGG